MRGMRFPRLLVLLLVFRLPWAAAAGPQDVVIATYNVENYLGEESAAEAGAHRGKPKSEKAMAAVVQVIKDINLDILGVCEMGEPERFEDFKKRLAAAGLGYRDYEYV